MSNDFAINGNAPTVVIQAGFAFTDDIRVSNTGPSPIYLLDGPGLYSSGLKVGPGATAVWSAGRALYASCDPGFTSVLSWSINSGDVYSGQPQNEPKILWLARNVPTLDTRSPGRLTSGGLGPNFFGFDTSVPSVQSDTGFIDISNYSSVLVSAYESQNTSIESDTQEIRRITVSWYQKLGDGTYYPITENFYWHYCLPFSTLVSGQIVGNPQFRLLTPARAQYVRVRVGAVTFNAPVSAGNIIYTLAVVGDNRPIQQPWAAFDAGYYYTEQLATIDPDTVDMSTDALDTGSASLGTGNTTIYVSHRSGPCWCSFRISNTAAIAAGTRVALQHIGGAASGQIFASFIFTTGATASPQTVGGIIHLPDRPFAVVITNSQGVAQVFNWAFVMERQ